MSCRTTSTTQSGHVTTRVARTNSRFSRNYSGLLASLGIAAVFLVSAPAFAIAPPVLGNAQSFAILGGQTVTVAGTGSIVNGDVGVSTGSTITGVFIVTPPFGKHYNDGPAIAAQTDTNALNVFLTPGSCDAPVSSILAGATFYPGTYCFSSSANLASGGTLTLDALGDPNAVFIFQVGSALTTISTSNVVLKNGADPCNVFWQATAGATLGGVTFAGNVVSIAAISVGPNASLTGRALTTIPGAVSLVGSDNYVGGCSAAAPPLEGGSGISLSKAFVEPSIAAGGVSTLTITLSNSNATASTLIAPLIDTLPTGMTIANLTNATTNCGIGGLGGGVVTANAGENTVTLSTESTIPGGPGSCWVKVDVTVTTATSCSFTNTLSHDALKTSFGNNPGDVSGSLNISPPCGLVPPVAATAIPTLSEWALIVLAAFMAITGFIAMRRKER